MTDSIEFSASGGVAVLRVNRPDARNALNWEAQDGFLVAVERAARDDSLRALVVTGAGDQAFVSGGDLKELSRHPEADAGARLNRTMSQALAALVALPIPVIAAVNGDAIGGGAEIVTACDLSIAAPAAHFSFRQVHNGLTSGWGGTSRLVAQIGQRRAMELLLTTRVIDAAEAQRIGLIHRIAAPGVPVLEAAVAWAEELLALPRRALAATKSLVHAAGHLPPEDANRYEAQLFVNLWTTADHLEALAAFNEKRPPRFNQEPRDDHV